MADIYEENGTVDLQKARDRLAAVVRTTTTADAIRRDMAEIQIAALIDVASSLRTIALESALIVAEYEAHDPSFTTADDMAAESALSRLDFVTAEDYAAAGGDVRDWLDVGDTVAVRGERDRVGQVTNLGIDQGEVWAEVYEDNGAGEVSATRFYVRNLELLEGDKPFIDSAPVDAREEYREALADDAAPVDPDVIDDPDIGDEVEDFTPPESALDALDAAEKKTKKKGSKK